jgi:hypothetical protein
VGGVGVPWSVAMDPVVIGSDSSNAGASSEVRRARAGDARTFTRRAAMISSLPVLVMAGCLPELSPPVPWTGNGEARIFRRTER